MYSQGQEYIPTSLRVQDYEEWNITDVAFLEHVSRGYP